MSKHHRCNSHALQRAAFLAAALALVGACSSDRPQVNKGPAENLPPILETRLPPGSMQLVHEIQTGELRFEWWLLHCPTPINLDVDLEFEPTTAIPGESVLALVQEFAGREVQSREGSATFRGWSDEQFDYRLSGIPTNRGWYYRLEVIER